MRIEEVPWATPQTVPYFVEAERLRGAGSWALRVATREFVHWSPEQYRLHGLDPRGGVPSWADVQQQIHPEDRDRCIDEIERALRERGSWSLEYRCLLPDGAIKVIQSIAHPMADLDGEALELVGTDIDITDRKRVEEALRESEDRFRTFVDHAADAFFLHDTGNSGRILDVNRQACESLGYSREELIGRNPMDFDAELSFHEVAGFADRIRAGETIVFDSRHRRRDGTEFPVEIRIRPFQHGGRQMSVGLVRDVTERKRAEKALNDSHDLLRAVIGSTPDAILVKDLQGRYEMINSAGARLLGKSVEEIVGKTDAELFAAQAAQAFRERDIQIVATGRTETFEETVSAAGGVRTYLSTEGPYHDRQGNMVGTVRIARDVTELKRLEAELRQAQKMEAVGRLAGGIAHDFNNLLLVINGFSEMVVSNLAAGDPNRSHLYEVQRAGERAAELTRQLLIFSRKQVLQPKVISLNPLLVDLCKMLQRLIGEDIELTLALDEGLGMATLDPGQFEQAVINLALNARDAMPETGELRIETQNVRVDANYAGRHPEVRPGDYVVVAVSDTGTGMDEPTKARIFEPFFTTKEAGKGTGLGLAMVYGFVTQSGGHIEVENAQRRGTTFKLYLPRTEEGGPSWMPTPEDFRAAKGSETILLVEDEEAVRSLARLVLQAHGYNVLEARHGEDAIAIARDYSGTIHMIVTDMLMPRMGGRILAEQLTRTRPNLRVLFMSGYRDDVDPHRAEEPFPVAFISKPFSSLTLARKVRELLDGDIRPEATRG